MKTKLFALVLITVLLVSIMAGCNFNESISDYAGWWSYEWRVAGVVASPPFFYAEIKEDGSVDFYGEYGDSQGEGNVGYDEESNLFFINTLSGEHTIYLGEEDGVTYIELSTTDRYTYSSDKPEIIGSDIEPPDPFEGSDGLWQAPQGVNPPPPYAYLKVFDHYVITYDENGTVIDEGYLDYNEQRGLNGNYAMHYSIFAASFWENDGEKYFSLMEPEKWQEGFDWQYSYIEALPFEEGGISQADNSPVGVWNIDDESDLPFSIIEVLSENPDNDDNVTCMDADGNLIDIGTFDYDGTQGSVMRNPVIVSFPKTGIYAVHFSEDYNIMFVAVASDWGTNAEDAHLTSFTRQESGMIADPLSFALTEGIWYREDGSYFEMDGLGAFSFYSADGTLQNDGYLKFIPDLNDGEGRYDMYYSSGEFSDAFFFDGEDEFYTTHGGSYYTR